MTDGGGAGERARDVDEWKFETGDKIVESDPLLQPPEGEEIPDERKVLRRLLDVDKGERFYYLDTEHGRNIKDAGYVELHFEVKP